MAKRCTNPRKCYHPMRFGFVNPLEPIDSGGEVDPNPYPLETNPYFWLDGYDQDLYTSSNDNIGRIVDTATGREGTFSISSYDGTLAPKPSWNGEGWYFNTVNAVKVGTTSDFTRFSNGNNFTIMCIWKQLTMSTTYNGFIFTNNNGTSTQIGISLAVDNRSAQSRSRALVVTVTRGVAGVVYNVVNQNCVTENAYNYCIVTYDGSNLRVYVNGTLLSTTAPTNAHSASNASNVMHIGANTSAATGASMYLKHLMFYDSLLSAGDRSLLDTWAAAEMLRVVTPTNINIYLIDGQSNADGRGTNGAISSELSGNVGAYMYKLYSTTPTSQAHWDQLQLGVNNQIAAGAITQHGIEMRFGYEMNLNDPGNVGIIKYAIGGTGYDPNADAAGDWNTTSTGELYDKYKNAITNAIAELVHILRRTPVFRGRMVLHGEYNSVAGKSTNYKTYATNLHNGIVDHINSLGYSTALLRLFIFRTKNGGGGGFDPTDYANIVADQTDIGANYLTDNPTYTTKTKATTSQSTDDMTMGDGLHYDTASINTLGNRAVTYFEQYQNE